MHTFQKVWFLLAFQVRWSWSFHHFLYFIYCFLRNLCDCVKEIVIHHRSSESREKVEEKWRNSLATQGGLCNWVLLPAVKYSWETVKRNMFYKLQERNQYKSQCEKKHTFFFFSLSYLSKVNNNIIWKTACCMNSAWKDWIFHSMKPNCAVAACSWISTRAWKRRAGRRMQNQILSFLEDDGLWIRSLKLVTMDMNIFCRVLWAMT